MNGISEEGIKRMPARNFSTRVSRMGAKGWSAERRPGSMLCYAPCSLLSSQYNITGLFRYEVLQNVGTGLNLLQVRYADQT
jgi:hypothetical protein